MQRVARWSSADAWLFAGVSAALCVAALLPATWLDSGPSLCLWHLAGVSRCPGCGMSRALWHALHGEFGLALAFNWRVALVAPLLAYLYVRLGVRVCRARLGRVEACEAGGHSSDEWGRAAGAQAPATALGHPPAATSSRPSSRPHP
jgi:hypothetical protein